MVGVEAPYSDGHSSENGQATIGVKADGNAGNWGNIDDFEFYTDHTEETLTAPSRVTEGDRSQ